MPAQSGFVHALNSTSITLSGAVFSVVPARGKKAINPVIKPKNR